MPAGSAIDTYVSPPASAKTTCDGSPRPRLRGLSHLLAFFVAVPAGVALALSADGATARAAAIAFAASVGAMFGVSSLFHRLSWTPKAALRMGRLDHATIYGLIAGTYAPIGLLVVHGDWRVPLLAAVWGGALLATAAKLAWRGAPVWFAPAVCVALGWLALPVVPQIAHRIGLAGTALFIGGGVAYTSGAVIYALRRPDPVPAVFGYHEVFHALVIVAVACQYAAIAFFVLPRA